MSARLVPAVLQRQASDPLVSSWVGASAGSGKTKVLIDRMLRLLLDGVAADKILAITFTNAAAAEMSNRLNATLAAWAIIPPRALDEALDALQGEGGHDAKMRARARQLFARIVDFATGVRIHTIHGFCQSVLRRFPIEAGLSPHFALLDERSSDELLTSVVTAVLEEAVAKPNTPLAQAIGRISVFFAEARFNELLDEIIAQRSRYQALFESHESLDHIAAHIREFLCVPPSVSSEFLLERGCRDETFERANLLQAAELMRQMGSDRDGERAAKIAHWVSQDVARRVQGFDVYCAGFLTGDGKPFAKAMTAAPAKARPDLAEAMVREAERLMTLRGLCRTADLARSSEDLLVLASVILESYATRKAEAAQVDYEDLILRTRALLRGDADAAWVHYKLDGGIDHVLLDESQDTNPEQWDLIEALAREFLTGEGAVERNRTLFAVGDAKQSIFSFQRADPAIFARMRGLFAERITRAKKEWRPVDLDVSFRSVAPVLELVDKVFEPREVHAGVSEAAPHHEGQRVGAGGLVELWPLAVMPEGEIRDPWHVPKIGEAAGDPAAASARRIAKTIQSWLAKGEMLESQGRPIRPSDIMVLVRSRTAFVPALVRALKQADVPVAGVDRMVLTKELAVADLLVLANFLLLAEDDMSLAILLRSPLIGLSDEQLFALAHGRSGSLWQAAEESGDPGILPVTEWLRDWRGRADFVAPYELFAEILNTPCPADPAESHGSGRRAFAARLGSEALDPLDEFLSAALAYQAEHAPSLQGFVGWISARPVEIKREPRKASAGMAGEVTIMTVHGSKGLQAPIIFLADTGSAPTGRRGPHILWQHGTSDDPPFPLWASSRKAEDTNCAALRDALKQRGEEEYRRLLYVALTRAQDRLYAVGWQGKRAVADGCWHRLIETGISKIEATSAGRRRMAIAAAADKALPAQEKGTVAKQGTGEEPKLVIPAYAVAKAPTESRPVRPLAPSQLIVDDTSALSPLIASDKQQRFERGRLIHRLLQTLPDMDKSLRSNAADRYLAAASDHKKPERDAIYAEVARVLADPAFGAVFGPGSLAEVPVSGLIKGNLPIAGQIDRLVVLPDEVLLVDFKSNRPPPADQFSVPPAYLAQMAVYRAALQAIYPSHTIRAAILWTNAPRLMEIPAEIMHNIDALTA